MIGTSVIKELNEISWKYVFRSLKEHYPYDFPLDDRPLVVQFAASNALDLSNAVELVKP